MNARWLKARQTKYAAYATLYTLIVIGIIVLVNFLANRYDKTYDTTSNKRYTLSDQTRKVVQELKQDATITYFNQTSSFTQAKDLLDQYQTLSSRLHVEYKDPDKDPQAARDAGLSSYGTTIVRVGAKKENASSLTEEAVTGALIRTVKDSVRTICFVTGSGEHRIDDTEPNGYSGFKDLLAKDNYSTKAISLLQSAEVPADCTAVIVGGPTSNYVQPQVDALKKYVEGGGRVMFLVDPPIKAGQTEIAENGALSALLSMWGVTLNQDLILDLNPIGQLAGVGPQVALVTTYDAHPIVSAMKGTATGFPMSRSIEFKASDRVTLDKLFSSSDTSLATTELRSGSIQTNDPRNKKGPLTMAVAGTYKTGKENSEGRFVVVGTSFWAANSFLTFNGNSDLAMNAVNWLASDEDLISIRPKEQENRPITMTNSQLRWVRIWSQFLLPLGIVLMGVSVWWRRR